MSQVEENFGPFRLVKELGRGATGTVYLAEQTNLGRECALKVLAPELVRDQTFLDRFRREGKIAASLRHKNIVRIFDLVESETGFGLAMDYIEGRELRDLITDDTRLPQAVALDIIGQVLEALDYAHKKGVVHRDVKPANILIEDDGGIFLTDFSIARMAGGEKITRTGTVIGTPEYMAPEQFDGKEVDARADVYATALILYELLSGVNPFQGDTLAEIIKKQVLMEPPTLSESLDLPENLVALVKKGLRKSPRDRFQTAGEMRKALLSLGQPIEESGGSLTQFLSSVESGSISMDDAVIASEKVKEAIDKGFKRRLTIVMLDLAGSSKIKVPNQTLIADRAFQDYRGTINKILEENGCERYDWSGDGAIALFPEPVPAVDAAVKVQQTVAEVSQRHKDLPDALLVRIGIRTGMVYYDPRRTLGEFASRTVDQAGHLEKDCPPGSIRLGDETVKAIAGRYDTQSIGTNRDDIEVFEISMEGPEEPPRPNPVAPQKQTQANATFKPKTLETERKQPLQVVASKEVFRPKSEGGKKSVPASEDDTSPWWGWRTLGLVCFLWASTILVNKLVPGVRIPRGPRQLFTAIYAIHLLSVPVYALIEAARGNMERAKEASLAGGVFFAASITFLLFVASQ